MNLDDVKRKHDETFEKVAKLREAEKKVHLGITHCEYITGYVIEDVANESRDDDPPALPKNQPCEHAIFVMWALSYNYPAMEKGEDLHFWHPVFVMPTMLVVPSDDPYEGGQVCCLCLQEDLSRLRAMETT